MANDKQNRDLRIHIDGHPYNSPTPTTGAALYALGNVQPPLALFRESNGNREEEFIPPDALEVRLHENERFHSGEAPAESYRIIVNTEDKTVDKAVLSFLEVVKLAFPAPNTGPNVIYTVTYKHAVAPMRHGSLVAGGEVQVKNGTIFNVTETDKS